MVVSKRIFFCFVFVCRGTEPSRTAVVYASSHQNCLLHSRITCTVAMKMKWTKSLWFLAQNVHLLLSQK